MLDTSIKVQTDQFDGPLGLLLILVEKEEMNIRELNLTKITGQYLAYLSQMRDLNFDVAGEYLYMAAALLLLKSKNCISEEEGRELAGRLGDSDELGNITSTAELIRRLEELKHFQKMGAKLWDLPKKGHDIFTHPKINRKEIVNSILVPMELEKLTEAMMDFIVKQRRKYTVVRRDRLSIKEKLVFLKSHLQMGEQTTLENLIDLDGGHNIDNTVITFISLLELARLKRLNIFQNEDMGAVYVELTGSLEDFDVESANGFDEENPEAENDAAITAMIEGEGAEEAFELEADDEPATDSDDSEYDEEDRLAEEDQTPPELLELAKQDLGTDTNGDQLIQ